MSIQSHIVRMRNSLQHKYWQLLYGLKRLRVIFDYGKLLAIKSFQTRTSGTVRLAGYIIHFGDITQLTGIFKEVFVDRDYYCALPAKPIIIDAGANIGISTLFFKTQYPHAKIIAFEPHPKTFELLKRNIEENALKGVELHNSALGSSEEPITFYVSSDMAQGDIGASAIKQHVEYFHLDKGKTIEITVPCQKLSQFIQSPVDLLKLDVEGSEGKVIRDLKENLRYVKNLVMEYHYNFTYPENPLSLIIAALEESQHLYRIEGGAAGYRLSKEETYLIRSVRH